MQNSIQKAIEILTAGGIVAFPTETVYGLGANALNEEAIRKVFMAKGRPIDHPLIVHIANIKQLEDWAINIPENAKILANHFWPGPLTLVLPKKPSVSDLITGGQDTIALRIPKHDLTLTMLKQFGSGIVGPSANTYGRISPTSAAHVQHDLGNKVNHILDGGNCEIGIESTIVCFVNDKPQVLRQGDITEEHILQVLGNKFTNLEQQKSTIRVPGQTKAHYAPRKPLFLVQSSELLSIAKSMVQENINYSYLCFQANPGYTNIAWHQAAKQSSLYAKQLYALLHQLDAEKTIGIIAEMPPDKNSWSAITDRLTRASSNLSQLFA